MPYGILNKMKPRVLIVDDDPISVKILEKFLEAGGYETNSAFSAKEGIENAKKFNPDLVLLDLKLPDKSGIDVIPIIKSINDEIPIIMVSGSGETNDIVSAMKSGASDYVQKPIDSAPLLGKIKNLLEIKKISSTQKELTDAGKYGLILGESPQIKRLIRELSKISAADSPVLILGESGVGKSLLAQLIHQYSNRRQGPFVTINCAAIPANLLESELFGHVKGSFTGAVQDKPGKFEYADKGTIFLDEIGDLSLDLQVKLLRVLQGQEFERVGGLKTIHVDVRIVAATNRNLEEAIVTRQFREDLFYRLNVLPIFIPPLRERKEDVAILANHFFQHYCSKTNKRFDGIPDTVMKYLLDYKWPGNVRELQNVIERAVVLAKEPNLKMPDFIFSQPSPQHKTQQTMETITSIKTIEKNALMKALEQTGGNISKAAKILNLSRDTIYRRLKKYKIALK